MAFPASSFKGSLTNPGNVAWFPHPPHSSSKLMSMFFSDMLLYRSAGVLHGGRLMLSSTLIFLAVIVFQAVAMSHCDSRNSHPGYDRCFEPNQTLTNSYCVWRNPRQIEDPRISRISWVNLQKDDGHGWRCTVYGRFSAFKTTLFQNSGGAILEGCYSRGINVNVSGGHPHEQHA